MFSKQQFFLLTYVVGSSWKNLTNFFEKKIYVWNLMMKMPGEYSFFIFFWRYVLFQSVLKYVSIKKGFVNLFIGNFYSKDATFVEWYSPKMVSIFLSIIDCLMSQEFFHFTAIYFHTVNVWVERRLNMHAVMNVIMFIEERDNLTTFIPILWCF